MKSVKLYLCIAVGVLFFTNHAAAQLSKTLPATASDAPKNMAPSGVTWTEDSFTFGDVEKGHPATHVFTFKNTSKQTVTVTNVKASCGCTATDYTKTPIKPGATGIVTATYNAAHEGNFTKTITVTISDSEVNKILTIKGNVVAPANEEPADDPVHS